MSILVVGATPAVQRTMRFANFTIGAVNRAVEAVTTSSGKGVNVARVVARLGGDSLLVQFLGGDGGRFIAGDLKAAGVRNETVWVRDDATTRTCTTILTAAGVTTELVEESSPVTIEDVAALEAAVTRHLPAAQALCLSGSYPRGVPEELLARLVGAAREAGVPTFVDTQRGPLRQALSARPFFVKPNREEAAATLGLTLSGDPMADGRAAVAALLDAGSEWALVSMGPEGSMLGDKAGHLWRLMPPRVAAINPIGSGDSLAAGLVLSFVRGAPIPEAAVHGTACAAANCLTLTSGVVFPEDVTRLLPQAGIEQIA